MTRIQELQAVADAAPDSGPALFALGVAHADRGEYQAARARLERATAGAPGEAVYHRALGHVLGREPARQADAVHHFERAVELDPQSPGAHEALGDQLAAMSHPDARAAAIRAVAAFPDRRKSYVNLCRACVVAGEEAEQAIRGRLPRGARVPLFEFAYAKVLMDTGRYDRAGDYLRARLAHAPMRADLLGLFGRAAGALGEPAAARRALDDAVRLSPDDSGLAGQLLAQLWRTGDYGAVRQLLRSPGVRQALRIDPRARLWSQEAVAGRSILLTNEGCGFGDTLHWSRAAPLLHEAGARVAIQCQSPLAGLLGSIPGLDRVVVPHDEPIQPDLTCHSGVALWMLEWDWPAIGAQVPFVHVASPRRAAWRARRAAHGEGLHVGVEWRAASERVTCTDPYTYRSMPFAALAPLARIPGVVCHSLHFGVSGLQDMRARAGDIPMSEFRDETDDFAETAAAISAVVLVVTVDTAVAHVAGALGCPAFLLLPYRADWRWGDSSAPSPWYPSCTIVRQPSPGAWAPVVDRVAEALRSRAGPGLRSEGRAWVPDRRREPAFATDTERRRA